MAPVHQLFHLRAQVQVGHRYIARPVVEMTTTGRIVDKITTVQNVGQGHMLQECAKHLLTQVRIKFVYTVVAKTTPQVIALVGPMITGRS